MVHGQLDLDQDLRTCCTCRLAKPTAAFSPKNRRCRECRNRLNNESNRRNAEAVNARNRAKYHRNKAQHRATQRRYEVKQREASRTDRKLWAAFLWEGARGRARRFGLLFTITRADVVVPELCPVLGLLLRRNVRAVAFDSATVDRIDSSRGYEPGNVIVVSMKANAIKSNGTPDEILRVGLFYSRLASA